MVMTSKRTDAVMIVTDSPATIYEDISLAKRQNQLRGLQEKLFKTLFRDSTECKKRKYIR